MVDIETKGQDQCSDGNFDDEQERRRRSGTDLLVLVWFYHTSRTRETNSGLKKTPNGGGGKQEEAKGAVGAALVLCVFGSVRTKKLPLFAITNGNQRCRFRSTNKVPC